MPVKKVFPTQKKKQKTPNRFRGFKQTIRIENTVGINLVIASKK